MKLVLVRHGITECWDDGIICGWLNTPVSQNGIRHLLELKEKYDYPQTDFYFTTDLLRTIQTFHFLYPDQKCSGQLKEFKEHGMGDYEGMFVAKDTSIYNLWLTDSGIGHEEQFSPFLARIGAALEKLYDQYSDNSVTLVCHAGVIRAVIMYLNDICPLDYLKMHPKNGMAYIIEVHKEGNKLRSEGFYLLNGASIYEK